MGNNHAMWFDASKRKILIMAFENIYQKKIAKAISKIDININDSIGFTKDEVYYKKLQLKLWYLSTKNRHLWKHQYLGAQGIIMTFSFKELCEDKRITFEALNVFCDTNLNNLPILVLVDSDNKDDMIVEKLRKELNQRKDAPKNIQFLLVNFNEDISHFKTGFDWLCETMQPL